MFCFGKPETDSLPLCSDTIRQHIKFVIYQTVIWGKAYLPRSVDVEGVLVPVNHAQLISVAPSAAAVEVLTFHVYLCAIALTATNV